MDGYEEFQRIMAEINYKKQLMEGKENPLPPGFEELFRGFKK